MMLALPRVAIMRRVSLSSHVAQCARRLTTQIPQKQPGFKWTKWLIGVPTTVVAVSFAVVYDDIRYFMAMMQFVTKDEVDAFRERARKIVDARGSMPTEWKEVASSALIAPIVMTLEQRYAKASPELRSKAQAEARDQTFRLLCLSYRLNEPALFSVMSLFFYAAYTSEEIELIAGYEGTLRQMTQGVLVRSEQLQKLRSLLGRKALVNGGGVGSDGKEDGISRPWW